MNKKRYIPLVIVGALILSLIAVFPAFGAGDAGFVASGDISKTDPDRLDYSRQGGSFGLYLDDDSLDVPVRRVLIPELDAELVGTTSVTAHSDMVDTTTGAGVVLGNYVMIGDHNVRKVTGVATATPVPDDSSTAWYLEQGTGADDAGTAIASPVTTDITGLPGFTLTGDGDGFDDDETITLAIEVTPDPPTAVYPTDLNITANANDNTNNLDLTFGTTTNTIAAADHDGTLDIGAAGFVQGDVDTDKGVYTLVFTATQGTGDDEVEATHTLTISIYDLDDGVVTLTLDRPFAESTAADMPENLYVITDDDITDDSSWGDDYGLYAMAVELPAPSTDSSTTVRALTDPFHRYKGDNFVVSSNIGSDDRPSASDIADGDRTLGDAQQRIAGNESGKVGSNDALIVVLSASGTPPVWEINTTGTQHPIDDVDDEEVIFSNASTARADTSVSYLAAWFDEPNDTGGTVTVRSQAYTTETVLVMMETDDESGKFAMVIEAVAYDSDDNEDLASGATDTADNNEDGMYDMTVTSGAMPMVPVNPRDTITLESSDSRATLTIETTPPTFTGLSPAHNFAGSDNRPTVSGQVTDGDSGLSEGAIDILFRVVEVGASPVGEPETVNPKDDADSDDIAGGFAVSGRVGDNGGLVPDDDATVYWWIRATDKAGNVGFSDQMPTDDDGEDKCEAQELGGVDNPTIVQLERAGCQPYVILLDSTNPTMDTAETGRHWNTALQTGDSKDKTEYRVTKSDASSVLVIFGEHLDATSVSANDFEVDGATPADAIPYNVTVRAADGDDDYVGYDAGLDSVSTTGDKLGYVFLRLSSDLDSDDTPKVELVGDVLDLAGNEQDEGVIAAASDRIAPALTVTIDEGTRPSTKDKVNLTITADENVGSPTVTIVEVNSYDDKAKVRDGASEGSATVKFVSATKYTAEVSAGSDAGLYTIHVKATDAAGGNVGMTGAMSGDDLDVSDDTKLVLFEHDGGIGAPDIDPDTDGIINDTFETDDTSGYIRIDFSAEAREYDNVMYDMSDGAKADDTMGDDLDTHAAVTIVSATLNGDDISGSLQPNDAGNVFLYRAPAGLTVGDHELEIIAEDDAGNRHTTAQTATITITERKPFSLKLNPGWNLVSIPGEPADPDINVVIPADRQDISSVLAYDPTVPGLWLSASRGADGMFSGTLKNITATRGYWVETNTFASLPVMIPKQSPGQARVLPTIPVAKGWNMVPILDVDGDFKLDDDDKLPTMGDMDAGTRGYLDGLEGVRAYTFNTITNRWDLVSEVQIGKGYWVYVSKAGIIVP